MPIDGSRRADVVAGSTFVAMGERLGRPGRVTRKLLTQLVDATDGGLADLDDLPFGGGKIRELRRVVEDRRACLLR